jgi:hypothetical protein
MPTVHFYSKYVRMSKLKRKEVKRRNKYKKKQQKKQNMQKRRNDNRKSSPDNLTHKQRHNQMRRKTLGFMPMNEKFKRAEFHHLHFDIYGNENKNIGIYIPRKIHRSIAHNGATYTGMKELINAIIDWYPKKRNETFCNTIILLLVKIRTPFIKEKK